MTSVSCTVFGTVSSMRVSSDWHANRNEAGSAANLVAKPLHSIPTSMQLHYKLYAPAHGSIAVAPKDALVRVGGVVVTHHERVVRHAVDVLGRTALTVSR